FRPALLVFFLFALALLPETFVQQHYASPAAGLVNLFCVQGLRYVRCLRRPRALVGRSLVRLAFVLSLVTTGLYVADFEQAMSDDLRVKQRQDIKSAVLKDKRGYQLVIVKYGKHHNIRHEWVYNEANIDRSRVVWARDMGDKANA